MNCLKYLTFKLFLATYDVNKVLGEFAFWIGTSLSYFPSENLHISIHIFSWSDGQLFFLSLYIEIQIEKNGAYLDLKKSLFIDIGKTY